MLANELLKSSHVPPWPPKITSELLQLGSSEQFHVEKIGVGRLFISLKISGSIN